MIRELPNDLGFYLRGTLLGEGQASRYEEDDEIARQPTSAVYVIVQDRECGIIDTGLGIKAFHALMGALNRRRLKPQWLILTHDHPDHVGNGHWFRDQIGAPLYCHPLDLPLIEQPLKIFDDQYMENAYGRTLWAAFEEMNRTRDEYEAYQQRVVYDQYFPVKVDATCEDGDLFELGDLQIEILHTPGHSPGSISAYIPNEGMLFAGDVPLWFGPGRPYPLGDHQAWQDSMQRLLLLDTDFIGWGHSIPTVGRRKCRRFLKNTLRRAEQIREAVVDELMDAPQTIKELSDVLYDGNIRVLDEQQQLAEDSVHALLVALWQDEQVEPIVRNGLTYWRLVPTTT